MADQLAVTCFVNADLIARGLNAIRPESVSVQAGRVMLGRLRELVEERADFAFETTLAGRSYFPFLRELRETGYVVEMYFFWLRSANLAVQRVEDRVRSGGHHVPEETIRLRYARSLRNFWTTYRYEADSWFMYDNSTSVPVLLGAGCNGEEPLIADPEMWRDFRESVGNA